MPSPLHTNCSGRYTGLVIIPEGYGQATFLHTGSGAPFGAACTLGFINGGDDTAAQAAEDWALSWSFWITPHLSSVINFAGCLVKLGPNDTGASALHPAADPGDQASTGVSPAVCYLIRKNTLFGGRQGRGRMFLPGPIETTVGPGGDVPSATITSLTTAFGNFFDSAVGRSQQPQLLHDSGLAPYPITGFSVDPRVATQRRRNRR